MFFLNIFLYFSIGGKDSLVTLDNELTRGRAVELMYVADGLSEFANSWRLNGIKNLLSDLPFHLVRHVFNDPKFERSARSFLQPTGHPWAALVIFDALLV
jgi:hypothetical protein